MRLVRSARECGKVYIHDITRYEVPHQSKFVRWVRSIWPRSQSVIGMTVHRKQGATTLSSSNIYEAFNEVDC